MKRIGSVLAVFLLFLTPRLVCGQSNQSFRGEIRRFLQADSLRPPPRNAILFVGSSSFRKWTDIDRYFPGYTLINRGFGGSQLSNLIFYADKIIYPYHPKQVIIYCGENDFDYDKSVSADSVFERFHTLFNLIREHLPGANIGFVSMKLSPSRKYAWEKIKKTNDLIADFIEEQSDAEFIDITKAMLDEKGQVNDALFLSDRLHMRPAGYEIWKKQIQPYLIQ